MGIDKHQWQGHAYVFLATMMWGLMAPIAKNAMTTFSPFTLTFFRMSGGAILFWLTSFAVKEHEHVERRDLLKLFGAALFAFVFNQGLFLTGLSLTSPIDATIVTTMLPIITMLLAAIWLKEPLTWLKIIGVLIGFSGALTLIFSSGSNPLNGSIKGDIMCLLAQTSFAIYLTLFKDIITKYSSVTINKWIFTFSFLCYIPLAGTDMINYEWQSVSRVSWLEAGYVVFFGSYMAYLLYVNGQSRLRPTIVSMYNYMQPIVASTLAVLIGMSTFTLQKCIAVLLVFAGVFVVTYSKSRADVEREKSKSKV